jgi:predicted dehydrogenase
MRRRAANYEALLADPQVDAVVLATPHSMHGAPVVAAAAAAVECSPATGVCWSQ